MSYENPNPKKEFYDLEGEILRIGKIADRTLERGENHLFPTPATAKIILNSLKEAKKYPTGTRLYHFKKNKNSLQSWQETLHRFGARAIFFSSLKVKIGHDVQETRYEITDEMFVLYLSEDDLKYFFEGLESHVVGSPYYNIGPDALSVSSTWP
jgi:hypothetical protein